MFITYMIRVALSTSLLRAFGFVGGDGEGDDVGDGVARTGMPAEMRGAGWLPAGDWCCLLGFSVVAGSQATEKAIAESATSESAVRLISFVCWFFISSSLIPIRLKSGLMIACKVNSQQWVFPQRLRGNPRSPCTETLVLPGCLHD